MTYLGATTWSVVAIGGVPTTADGRPDIAFERDGRIHGTGSINRFFGSYSAVDDQVTFGMAGSTMMAGPDELMEQEYRFLAALQGTKALHWTDGRLTLGEGDGAITLERSSREASG
jgi:heat shock protein HslJ